MWINNKKYLTVPQWVKKFNEDYSQFGCNLKSCDVHKLFGYFGIKSKNHPHHKGLILYPFNEVEQLRTMSRSKAFKQALFNLSHNGKIDCDNEVTQDNDYDDESNELSFRNNENDMEKYSDYLINNKYQFESRKKILISKKSYDKLFEDVYISDINKKKKNARLTYQKHKTKYNVGNYDSADMIKTDKMDNDNADTYEVPLKGGIVSYNITSINGTEVMHYFKRIFDKQKTYVKLKKYDNEQYELEMADDEFREFMTQFLNKVENVIKHCISNFKRDNTELTGLSIYPVPSSSRFNVEMAKRMQFNTLCGFTPKVINQSLLKKDLSKLEKDNDFLDKNSDYYNSKYSDYDKHNASHKDYLDKAYSRYKALMNAQKFIDNANKAADRLLSWYYYRNVGGKRPQYYESLNEYYLNYIASVKQIVSASEYYNNIEKKTSRLFLGKIAKALKYSKGPSIEKRSGEIRDLLKSHGYLKNNYENIDLCKYEPITFEIKKLSNDIRMGLKNYFQPTNDEEIKNDALKDSNNTIYVIFDDNISGGATLSDICYQLQQLGAKYIIPITFGKMKTAWNSGILSVNKPINGTFNY